MRKFVGKLLTLTIPMLFTQHALAATADDDSWDFAAEVYFWGASVSGDTPGGTPVDLSFDDILKNLDAGLMGAFAASKGPWKMFIDGIYLDLSDKQGFSVPDDPNPPVTGRAKAELSGLILTLGGGYKLAATERYVVNAVLGARYLDLDAKLSVSPDALPSESVKESLQNWDAIVGAQGRWYFNEKWYAGGYADVGTGDSDITWQLLGSLGYSFGSWEINGGYRYLKWDFGKGDNKLFDNADISGPYAGVLFRF